MIVTLKHKICDFKFRELVLLWRRIPDGRTPLRDYLQFHV